MSSSTRRGSGSAPYPAMAAAREDLFDRARVDVRVLPNVERRQMKSENLGAPNRIAQLAAREPLQAATTTARRRSAGGRRGTRPRSNTRARHAARRRAAGSARTRASRARVRSLLCLIARAATSGQRSRSFLDRAFELGAGSAAQMDRNRQLAAERLGVGDMTAESPACAGARKPRVSPPRSRSDCRRGRRRSSCPSARNGPTRNCSSGQASASASSSSR